jgi:hypothetical protein
MAYSLHKINYKQDDIQREIRNTNIFLLGYVLWIIFYVRRSV